MEPNEPVRMVFPLESQHIINSANRAALSTMAEDRWTSVGERLMMPRTSAVAV
jgi:hypothetical protein